MQSERKDGKRPSKWYSSHNKFTFRSNGKICCWRWLNREGKGDRMLCINLDGSWGGDRQSPFEFRARYVTWSQYHRIMWMDGWLSRLIGIFLKKFVGHKTSESWKVVGSLALYLSSKDLWDKFLRKLNFIVQMFLSIYLFKWLLCLKKFWRKPWNFSKWRKCILWFV